jgi:hypothetical protein
VGAALHQPPDEGAGVLRQRGEAALKQAVGA